MCPLRFKHLRNARKMKRGFSLVELSIVLVILGLLVGGILAGQSLVQAANQRKIPSAGTPTWLPRFILFAISIKPSQAI